MGPASDMRSAEAEVAAIQAEMHELAVQAGLDIAGTFDPTPISDIAAAGYAASRGDWAGAGLSLLGVVPYLGDAIGKSTKAARMTARLKELNERLQAALRRLKVSESQIAAAQTAGQTKHHAAGKFTQSGRHVGDVTKLGNGRIAISFFDTLTVIRNPRKLAKHHGPIPMDTLVRELREKQFAQIKVGRAFEQGTKGEDSFVYVRKVLVDNKEYFEAVRIDPKLPATGPVNRNLLTQGMNGKPRQTPLTPGELQAADRPFRQNHIQLSGPETAGMTPATVAEALHDGRLAKGSDLSHFHHEMFPASRKNLDEYLKPGGKVDGLLKRDSGGYLIWDRRMRPGKASWLDLEAELRR